MIYFKSPLVSLFQGICPKLRRAGVRVRLTIKFLYVVLREQHIVRPAVAYCGQVSAQVLTIFNRESTKMATAQIAKSSWTIFLSNHLEREALRIIVLKSIQFSFFTLKLNVFEIVDSQFFERAEFQNQIMPSSFRLIAKINENYDLGQILRKNSGNSPFKIMYTRITQEC